MTQSELKVMLRHMLLGFGVGLVVMLAVGYGASALQSATPAATTSAR